jgi:O-antigen biosynthesis protein WbqP
MLERLLALLILIALCPLFFIVTLLILLDDGLPVFFTQKRVGKDYSFFMLYKFRSMKKYSPNVATHLLEKPELYVLKSGHTLRNLSIDELPNLINILKGEMGFVGPRPALFNQYDLIKLRTNAGISHLKPGLTGWAQINGRDEISIEEKVSLDKEYSHRKSIVFDMKIFFRTFISLF